jgi:hypothetical protein
MELELSINIRLILFRALYKKNWEDQKGLPELL